MDIHKGPGTSALLLQALLRFPSRIAFRWDDGELSYAATAQRIGRMQAVLSSSGLPRGTRVAMLAGNSVDAWCASMAAQACGMAVSWLNALAAIEDHLFQVQDFAADLLIVDASTHESHGAELAARCGRSLSILTIGPSELGPNLLQLAIDGASASMRDLSQPGDLTLVNYTGGTTGRGKGVLRDQHNLAEVTRAVLATFELPARPNFLAAAPISHVAGTLVLPVLLRGGTVRLLDRFSPRRVLDILGAEGISVTLLVPTMIYALLDEPALASTDLARLETVLYGASPMAPARLQEALHRFGPVFAQLYGQTEAYPLTYLGRDDHVAGEDLLGSCGFASAATAIALLDESDQPVQPGQVGEICVRGPHVMQGYLGRPELTAEALRGGWLHTGDMARQDERGCYWIVDRKKDMIVSGGFNVYPREVEDVLASDPAVAEVAVIGVPHPRWGEAVTALVVRRPGANPDEAVLAARLIELVRARKGAVHAPKQVHFLPALPRSAVGKVDKKALRQPYWAAQARQVA